MCDFVLKLSEARRKGVVESRDEYMTEYMTEDKAQSVNYNDSGLKDKSKLFSNFYGNISEKNENKSSLFDNSGNHSSVFDRFNVEEVGIVEEVPSDLEVKMSESVSRSDTTLDNGLSLLKESLKYFAKATSEYTSETLNNYHYELSEIYNSIVSHSSKNEFITKQHEKLTSDIQLEKEQELIKEQQKEKELKFSKMSSSVSRLTENLQQLNNIKNKLESLHKNESFSYSTPSEIKAKIKVFGKKLYEVFKVVQKDLNSPVKNEFWSTIQFSKDTKDYRLFREKLNTLVSEYNLYCNNMNTKYNDFISNG